MTPEEREQQWDTTIDIVRQVRAEAIEECAQVADKIDAENQYRSGIAAAIRALKDKP